MLWFPALGAPLGCLSRIEKSQILTDRDVTEPRLGGELDDNHSLNLMVEQAVAGRAPSSPEPPEAGAGRVGVWEKPESVQPKVGDMA